MKNWTTAIPFSKYYLC